MAPSRRFPISGKNIFLTYPRCPLTKEQVLSQIHSIHHPSPSTMKFIRVSRDLRADGEPNIHLFIQLHSKVQLYTTKNFNLESPSTSELFHPNVEAFSDPEAYIDQHGDDFTDWGEFQVDRISSWGPLAEIAARAGTKTAALAAIGEELSPSLLRNRTINRRLDKIFGYPPRAYVPRYPSSSFRITNEMQQWLADNLNLNLNPNLPPKANPKSIVIEGPSRIGKTEWARSLGPHNYLAGFFDLNPEFHSNDALYNVLDIEPSELMKSKHWKDLLGAKSSWFAKYKYGRRDTPLLIKGGIPSIVLCNPGEGYSYREFLEKKKNTTLKAWTMSHVEFVFVDSPLF